MTYPTEDAGSDKHNLANYDEDELYTISELELHGLSQRAACDLMNAIQEGSILTLKYTKENYNDSNLRRRQRDNW